MTGDGIVTGRPMRPMTTAERSRRYRQRRKNERAAAARQAHGLYAPFTEGNEAALVHGAHSPARVDSLAMEKARELLGADVPPYLADPAMGPQVMAWARAEAMAQLVHEWVSGLTVEQQMTPRRAGSSASPAEVWRKLEQHAMSLRKELGLTPLSRARLGRDLVPQFDLAAAITRLQEDSADA